MAYSLLSCCGQSICTGDHDPAATALCLPHHVPQLAGDRAAQDQVPSCARRRQLSVSIHVVAWGARGYCCERRALIALHAG